MKQRSAVAPVTHREEAIRSATYLMEEPPMLDEQYTTSGPCSFESPLAASVMPHNLRETSPALERAWNMLFQEKMRRNVTRWLSKLGVRDKDLPDVSQTVFEEVIHSFPTYDPLRSPPVRWLNGITMHVASHHLQRAVHRREVLVEPARLNVVGDDDGTSVHDVLVLEERRGFLFEIFLRLPADDARMLVAYHLDDRSMQELAAIRNMPLSTAYKRHTRALEAARRIVRKLKKSKRLIGETAHVDGPRR